MIVKYAFIFLIGIGIAVLVYGIVGAIGSLRDD
mgnify:CR=1 FL=1